MGAFLDCKIEQNFKQFEIKEEITQEKEQKNNKNKKELNGINSLDNKKKLNLIKYNFKEQQNKNNVKTNKRKLDKKNYNTDGNNINHINFFDDINEDEIIINTDEDQTEKKKKTKENKISNVSQNNNKKKVKNTIFINNSNVTISNRNNNNENKLKKASNHEIKMKNEYNCFNSNEENIELGELINKVFNNINNNNFNNNNINNNKAYPRNNNNKNILTESEIDKEYFDQLYSEQSQYIINNRSKNENDEKIINKLKEIKDKINNKNKVSKKKIKRYNTEFNSLKRKQIANSMNNRQIRKNIPTYRRHIKSSNNNYIFNSLTLNKNLQNFKKFKYNSVSNGYFSLENSFNKSYSSLFCKSVRSPFYNSSHYSYNNNNKSFRKKNSIGKWSRGTPGKFNLQNSYFNNSSLFNTSSGCINSQNNIKKNNNKKLYNMVSKNIIRKTNIKTCKNNKKSDVNSNKIIDIDAYKENNLENNLLSQQYRDIIEVDLPKNYNGESLVNNNLQEYNINNKIILNYNKLNNCKISVILYDGFLYKIIDKKNYGFKASKRYFQITKNCFRYYNEIEDAKNENEPLVQFDIRHIKDLQVINHDFLKDIKIDEKNIKFVFCIYLYQNDDFFVFAVSNESYGNSVFNVLHLLKNYYEDKK